MAKLGFHQWPSAVVLGSQSPSPLVSLTPSSHPLSISSLEIPVSLEREEWDTHGISIFHEGLPSRPCLLDRLGLLCHTGLIIGLFHQDSAFQMES